MFDGVCSCLVAPYRWSGTLRHTAAISLMQRGVHRLLGWSLTLIVLTQAADVFGPAATERRGSHSWKSGSPASCSISPGGGCMSERPFGIYSYFNNIGVRSFIL